MNTLIESLKGKLIVSCQALEDNALRSSETMARMALAAQKGGAAAIRANGVEDITAIRARVSLPIIGLNKEARSWSVPFITPTLEHARAVVKAGAQIVALDATDRPHPGGLNAAELIQQVKRELGVPVMADIATFEEGVAAAAAGADLLSTTLSGYTTPEPHPAFPDLALVRRLAKAVPTPVVAEGRYCTPDDLAAGFRAGAFAVVIGKSITNPEFITRYFLSHAAAACQAGGTEAVNEATRDLDCRSTLEMAEAIHQADLTVAPAVGRALPEIAAVAETVAKHFQLGGRLIYVGAGTSGRLAVQDAAECPPTYGVPPETVQSVMAGGEAAVFHPVEDAEDNFEIGVAAMRSRGVTSRDTVIGLSANGNASFVLGALAEAHKMGAATAAIVNNPGSRMAELADTTVLLETGPEVICGSTRMKAGTAQKMALNMISTIAMVKTGHVTGNFMTSMKPTNHKLRERAKFIVGQVCGVTVEQATRQLEQDSWQIRTAIQHLRAQAKGGRLSTTPDSCSAL